MRFNLVPQICLGLLLLSSSLPAVTLARIDCGGSGDSVWSADTLYSGGFRWGAAQQTAMGNQAIPYSSLRYGSFSYGLQFAPGSFRVTLKFLEPSATAAVGSRVFDVLVNGVTLFSGLDLFSSAGSLKPFDLSFPVTATAEGKISIVLKPVKGNAVLSGIVVESIDTPPPSAVVRWSCADGVDNGGSGFGSLMPTVFTRVSCENMTDSPVKIIKIRCRADGAGGTVDLLVAGASGYVSALPGGMAICLPGGAETVALPDASYPAGTILTWALRVNDSADPAVKIATYVWATVVLEQGENSTLMLNGSDLVLNPKTPLAGVQWDLSAPVGVTAGPALDAAGKTLYCKGARCLAAGLNLNTIAGGVVGKLAQPAGLVTGLGASPAGFRVGLNAEPAPSSVQTGRR